VYMNFTSYLCNHWPGLPSKVTSCVLSLPSAWTRCEGICFLSCKESESPEGKITKTIGFPVLSTGGWGSSF
jgi:hypothetical protein